MDLSVFSNNKFSEQASPSILLNKDSVHIEFQISNTTGGSPDYNLIDSIECDTRQEYRMNYDYWKKETMNQSFLNMNNIHIKDIAYQGKRYLPFIYEDLRGGNDSIIYMLELLFPEEIAYSNHASIRQARKRWLKILQRRING